MASVQEGVESIREGTFAGTAWGHEVNWGSKLAIAIAVVVLSALSGFAPTLEARAAGPTVGMVTKVENQAQVDGQPAAVGSPVHTNDTVSTGAKGTPASHLPRQDQSHAWRERKCRDRPLCLRSRRRHRRSHAERDQGRLPLGDRQAQRDDQKEHQRVVALRRDGRARHRLLVGIRSRAIWCAAGAQQQARSAWRLP